MTSDERRRTSAWCDGGVHRHQIMCTHGCVRSTQLDGSLRVRSMQIVSGMWYVLSRPSARRVSHTADAHTCQKSAEVWVVSAERMWSTGIQNCNCEWLPFTAAVSLRRCVRGLQVRAAAAFPFCPRRNRIICTATGAPVHEAGRNHRRKTLAQTPVGWPPSRRIPPNSPLPSGPPPDLIPPSPSLCMPTALAPDVSRPQRSPWAPS